MNIYEFKIGKIGDRIFSMQKHKTLQETGKSFLVLTETFTQTYFHFFWNSCMLCTALYVIYCSVCYVR